MINIRILAINLGLLRSILYGSILRLICGRFRSLSANVNVRTFFRVLRDTIRVVRCKRLNCRSFLYDTLSRLDLLLSDTLTMIIGLNDLARVLIL